MPYAHTVRVEQKRSRTQCVADRYLSAPTAPYIANRLPQTPHRPTHPHQKLYIMCNKGIIILMKRAMYNIVTAEKTFLIPEYHFVRLHDTSVSTLQFFDDYI